MTDGGGNVFVKTFLTSSILFQLLIVRRARVVVTLIFTRILAKSHGFSGGGCSSSGSGDLSCRGRPGARIKSW
ncbi:hypothetical protein DPMN_068898 [Dreissena polymorpha]|uniref:Uncharacterized protein n=1 Tax=Dreissena polymorpha TaxID=45954 RepID=A0A9D3Z2G8_DREPO|nr:hypothetical protein DPMN_068898 [Dreissena polymorpha]